MAKNIIPEISIIMPYCSNDYQFLRPNIKQLLKFTDNIYIIYSNRFWNGENENKGIIDKSIKENPEATFVRVEYQKKQPPIPEFFCRLIPKRCLLRPVYGPRYFEGLIRWRGYKEAEKESPDYYFFLDVDEIVDGEAFLKWLKNGLNRKLNAMIFNCYEYVRSPQYRSINWGKKGVLVKKRQIKKKDFFTYRIRRRFYQTSTPPKKEGILGLDGKPMIHHFSWIRSKKQFSKKVDITSIHGLTNRKERKIEMEFAKPLGKEDPIWGKNYVKVKPFIGFK